MQAAKLKSLHIKLDLSLAILDTLIAQLLGNTTFACWAANYSLKQLERSVERTCLARSKVKLQLKGKDP